MSKKETTLEEQLAEAEREVDRLANEVDEAEDELREVKALLEEAEEERDAIQEKIDAPLREAKETAAQAFLAARTGPQSPVGDRVIRTVCGISEIPPVYAARMLDGKLKGLLCAAGESWATNGHWIIRVDSIDGLAMISATVESVIGEEGPRRIREDMPRRMGSTDVRTFGSLAMSLEYNALIEDLFPGVEWHCRDGKYAVFHAVVDGRTVAGVMPCVGEMS